MAMTLIVLAATMGNKYGGLKQLEGIGPNGETILDFSIYDAVRVGFNKIVFVISRHLSPPVLRWRSSGALVPLQGETSGSVLH